MNSINKTGFINSIQIKELYKVQISLCLDESVDVFVDFPFLCFLLLKSSVKMSPDLNAEIQMIVWLPLKMAP